MCGLFPRLGLGGCFLIFLWTTVKSTVHDLHDLYLSVFLITSNVEVESKCEGTFCDIPARK